MDNLKESHKCPGIMYVSNLPPAIKPLSIRQLLSPYGDIGRVFLKKNSNDDDIVRKKERGNFEEGWVEFLDKKVAKSLALKLNNTNMGIKKRHKYYDYIWNIRYLPKFEWSSVNRTRGLEPGAYCQKKGVQMLKTKKEVKFFLDKADKNRLLNKIQAKKSSKKPKNDDESISRFKKFGTPKELNPQKEISTHAHHNSRLISKLFK
ncbi:hypothetical protein HZS_4634 [Henneguya salminicola]|nr:hypothetical protein HZS_4634 [Henneguya salminicola]